MGTGSSVQLCQQVYARARARALLLVTQYTICHKGTTGNV